MAAQTTRREFLTRVAPRDELVNVLEFEAEAARVLSAETARAIAGSDRGAFDRATFRPRMMINCVDLNLSVTLFGQTLFAPILVGPVSDQRRFHADGELATVRGASAGKAAVVVSSRASHPIEAVAAAATTPLLFQVFATDRPADNRAKAQAAERAGCKVVLLTVGATDGSSRGPGRHDVSQLETLRAAVSVPVVVKGVLTAADAANAVKRGAQGIVVSSYGRPEAPGQPAPLDAITPVVEAVGAEVPVLADGGFRRGTDIMKALAFGARAVLVARPAMWGLSAYGADGVQAVVELLQTELGRVMGCCGTPNLTAITRAAVKVHQPTAVASR
jgi:4-hydroxymandelate oxidase